jgi:hypothetical protein
MTTRAVKAGAVLKAAEDWFAAQEALLVAKQFGEQSEAEEEALDIAGSRLAVAVKQWRRPLNQALDRQALRDARSAA